MENITIPLPPPLKDFVDSEAAAGGFGNAADYIQALLRQEQKRKRGAEMQAMLDEGLASGEPIEWNAQTLENLKQEIIRRHAQRAGNSP